MVMLKTIHIVGVGLGVHDIGSAALRLIDVADVLAGEQRLLDFFPDHPGQKLPQLDNLAPWLDDVKRLAQTARVVVLSPGDPNQFDLASRIAVRTGPENVRIHPNVTIFQAAFARLKESWEGVPVVSFESQDETALYSAVRNHSRVAVFTNETFTPSLIARNLLDRGQTGWRMCVLENLESPDYRVTFHRLWEASERNFSPSNLVVLWQKEEVLPLTLGTPNDLFDCEDYSMMPREVRAAVLARLFLKPQMIMWDLGTDCGAVGLEATLFLSQGQVFIVESNPDRIKHIEANRTKFGVANLALIKDPLPEALNDLPDPDRIFIGDLDTAFKQTLDACAWRLKSGGIILITTSREEDIPGLVEKMTGLDLKPETLQIRMTRSVIEDELTVNTETSFWLLMGRNQNF